MKSRDRLRTGGRTQGAVARFVGWRGEPAGDLWLLVGIVGIRYGGILRLDAIVRELS